MALARDPGIAPVIFPGFFRLSGNKGYAPNGFGWALFLFLGKRVFEIRVFLVRG